MGDNEILISIAKDIGELTGGFAALDSRVSRVNAKLEEMDKKLDGLPCGNQIERLKKVECWQKAHNGTQSTISTEKMKGAISLKNGIILLVFTCVLSATFGFLSAWATNCWIR